MIRSEAAEAAGQDLAVHLHLPQGEAIIVVDGAGGVGDGRLAAERVVSHLTEELNRSPDPTEPLWWCDRLRQADALLSGEGIGEAAAVAVIHTGRRIAGASVGDCGAWLIADDRIVDLTAGQKRKPLLGDGGAIVWTFERQSSDGTLLVATDGLIKYAQRERIQAVALREPLEQAAADLIELVRLPSGGLQDDVAVAVCRGSN